MPTSETTRLTGRSGVLRTGRAPEASGFASLRARILPDPGLDLEQRSFQALCLIGAAVTTVLVIPLNRLEGLPLWVDGASLAFGLAALALLWAAKRGRYLKKTLLLAYVLYLDIGWFAAGGSQGSVGLHFFEAALGTVLFFRGRFRQVGVALLVANGTALLLAELAWPRLVLPFRSPTARTFDLITGFAISVVVCALMTWAVMRGLEREREQLRGALEDRQRAEAELAESRARLFQVEKLESLGSLAGGLAHDMNNVLGSILALASIHEARAEPGSALGRDMGTISRACERGGTLVKGLLGFARKRLTEVREVDLNALVREQVALLERTTLQRVNLKLELAEGLRKVKGDPAALGHALMNLCLNAVDAMPGGGTLTLRTFNGPDGTALLDVADTGAGMAREVLDRALDPFFTTKPPGQGTGLGLSVVYATLKAHGGRVDLQSEPGRGTRARLRLPAVEAAAEAAPRPPGAGRRAKARALKVLLVDDDELVRSSFKAVLENLGHTCLLTSGGLEALAALKAGARPDAVLLDMNMPGLDGAGTLPGLRRLDPDVPVFLITGRADQAALELVAAHPGVTLLGKPFSAEELQRQLEARTAAVTV